MTTAAPAVDRAARARAVLAKVEQHTSARTGVEAADRLLPVLPVVASVLPDRLALVLGTEGDGLSAHAVAAADAVVRIPMMGGVDALNVVAASAMAFWATRVAAEGTARSEPLGPDS